MSRRAALVLLVAVAACKGGGKPAAKAAATPIEIFVDDRRVATSVELTAQPRELAALVPGLPAVDTWLAVIAVDAAGQATTVLAPAKEHADTPPALAAVDGKPRFGLERGAALDGAVAGVVKVIVKTKDDRGAIAAEIAARTGGHGGGDSAGNRHDGEGERPVPSADLTIAIKTKAGASTFTGDKLLPLPTITAPTGDTQTPGWNLLDIMTAAGITGARVVSLMSEEGDGLRVEGADLDRAATVLYVKMNRGGKLRFRRYTKKGEAWEMTGELRGLQAITVIE